MNRVSQLLTSKQNRNEQDYGNDRNEKILTISMHTSVLKAAQTMNEHHVGSLVVTNHNEMIGIISERDILTRIVTAERDPGATMVGEIMTREVISCDPSTQLDEVRRVMREQRIRHIPVIDQGALVGMISIGDLNAASNADLSIEVKAMREYITNG
ncbi:MAG: CBS domain-containing protein [Phycisphaerales bacterium]|nr:CBS domain-containing protein [Phycisphaerales bacterium]